MPRARRSLRRSFGNRRSRNRSRKRSRRPKHRTHRSRLYRATQVVDVIDKAMQVDSADLILSLDDIAGDWVFLLENDSTKKEGTLSGAYSMDERHKSLVNINNLVQQGGDPFLLLCDAALEYRELQQQTQYCNLFDCGVAAREYIRICTRLVSLTEFHSYIVDGIESLETMITQDDDSELLCYCRYLGPNRSLVHAFVIHTNPESVTHGFGKRLRIVFSMQKQYDVACSGLGKCDGQVTNQTLINHWKNIGLPYTREQTWSKDNDRSQLRYFLHNIVDCTFLTRTHCGELFEAKIFVLRSP